MSTCILFSRKFFIKRKQPNHKKDKKQHEVLKENLPFCHQHSRTEDVNRNPISAYIIQLVQLSFRTWWLKLLDRSLTQWLQEVESYRQRHNWEWAEWYKRLHRTISIELIRLDIHHLIEWSCFILSMLFNLRTELWGGDSIKLRRL